MRDPQRIERVLSPDGRCLATVFVYNDKNEAFISSKEGFNFSVEKDGYRLMSDKVKSANIAISETKLDEMIASTGLEKVSLVEGFWKDKVKDENKIEYQDMLILKKK